MIATGSSTSIGLEKTRRRIAIVRAIVGGERDPARLALHRDPRCRKSTTEIARYLTGNWRNEHLFNLASALRLFDALETEIASYDAQLLKEVEAPAASRTAGRTGSTPPQSGQGESHHLPIGLTPNGHMGSVARWPGPTSPSP